MRIRLHLTSGLWFLLLALLLSACKEGGVETYTVDPESRSVPGAAAVVVRLPESTPEGWEPAEAAGGHRLAGFRIPPAEGEDEAAQMTVTAFPGTVGGLLANVNRWRSEVGQPDVSQPELADATERLAIADHTIHLVDVAGPNRHTLGAILPVPGRTWFFKLTGPASLVEAQREAFLQYLHGIEVSARPPVQPSQTDLPEARPKARPTLTYQTPDGWVEREPTAIRAASFVMAGQAGGEAYLAVIPLAGSGGTLLANVNQWRSTLQLENATEEQLPQMIEEIAVRGRPFKVVDFESLEPLPSNDRNSRLVVAFATVGEHTWFFKLAGDAQLVAEQKPVLLEFLQSVDFGTPE